MKKQSQRAKRAAQEKGRSDSGFVRGFVVSACLSAFQDVAWPLSPSQLKRTLRHALQGGVALRAASRAADRVQGGELLPALLAAAEGAVGVFLIEQLLRHPVQPTLETAHGQKEK